MMSTTCLGSLGTIFRGSEQFCITLAWKLLAALLLSASVEVSNFRGSNLD